MSEKAQAYLCMFTSLNSHPPPYCRFGQWILPVLFGSHSRREPEQKRKRKEKKRIGKRPDSLPTWWTDSTIMSLRSYETLHISQARPAPSYARGSPGNLRLRLRHLRSDTRAKTATAVTTAADSADRRWPAQPCRGPRLNPKIDSVPSERAMHARLPRRDVMPISLAGCASRKAHRIRAHIRLPLATGDRAHRCRIRRRKRPAPSQRPCRRLSLRSPHRRTLGLYLRARTSD